MLLLNILLTIKTKNRLFWPIKLNTTDIQLIIRYKKTVSLSTTFPSLENCIIVCYKSQSYSKAGKKSSMSSECSLTMM